jgi:hypothetical protein
VKKKDHRSDLLKQKLELSKLIDEQVTSHVEKS